MRRIAEGVITLYFVVVGCLALPTNFFVHVDVLSRI